MEANYVCECPAIPGAGSLRNKSATPFQVNNDPVSSAAARLGGVTLAAIRLS